MRYTLFFFSLFLLKSSVFYAQPGSQQGAGEIIQSLHKLKTTGSVLYIAAHPDDENTRLLGYLAGEKKMRTAYLSLTRGDGGQNLVGKEQGEALGLIRTQELLAARRTDGAEQFFTRANDFGFSKDPDETFSIWNKESILADVVLTIRKFKPDVIICRFPTTGEGGHGHHTASAILALEAFDAAADPLRFPEQLKYTETWQARRIFWNTFNFGSTNTTAPNQLKIDVGVFNPLIGKSYGEIASESRSMHKSQGFGSARQRGTNLEFFKLLKGDSAKTDLFDGINTSWNKLKTAKKIEKMVDDCIKNFNALSPESSVAGLVAIYKEIRSLDEVDAEQKYWKTLKLKETANLIFSCAGLWMEAAASDYMGIPGKDISLTTQIVNRSKLGIKLTALSFFNQSDTATSLTLKENELYTFKRKEKIPEKTGFSNPYWLNEKHEAGIYQVNNQALIGKPENDPVLNVSFSFSIQDLDFKVERGLVYKYTDPVKGEVYRPFEILPPATINISEKVFVFNNKEPRAVQITVKANVNDLNGKVELKGGSNFEIVMKVPDFTLKNKGDEAVMEATVVPLSNNGRGNLEAALLIDGKVFNKSIKRIEYDHIPYQFILSNAEAGLVNFDIKKAGLNIGYIPGAGDDIPACLKQIGYHVTVLTDELLLNEDLKKYSAIVTGIRAYNTNDRLQVYFPKLMDYVKGGGNLVVQYNTNSRIGPVLAKIGPYPFTISRDRVTNEKAEVKFTNEKHPALNFPNHIAAADFDNWVQERGIYFATEIDKQYETIFAMNDNGEKSSDGSLIIGKYGKGNFVYTGLVFFRELPAGVPGAYRLFVNLLSLPQNK
ncbi:MAG: PIG-L family deacetylase [Bacteroidota bacterium]